MASRTWNGSASNYLNTQQGVVGSQNNSAGCAWVKADALGVLGTIFGNRFDAGLAFQINANDELQFSFQESGVIYYLTAPLTVASGASEDYLEADVPLFVGYNVTHSQGGSPPVAVDFYAGQNAGEVEFIGSDSGGSFIASNGVQPVLIGANNFGTAQHAFSGELSRIGRWAGVKLSLAEFNSVAACDTLPPKQGNLAFFFAITGASPEPNFSGTPHALVVGTLPIADPICSSGNEGYFAMII